MCCKLSYRFHKCQTFAQIQTTKENALFCCALSLHTRFLNIEMLNFSDIKMTKWKKDWSALLGTAKINQKTFPKIKHKLAALSYTINMLFQCVLFCFFLFFSHFPSFWFACAAISAIWRMTDVWHFPYVALILFQFHVRCKYIPWLCVLILLAWPAIIRYKYNLSHTQCSILALRVNEMRSMYDCVIINVNGANVCKIFFVCSIAHLSRR